MKILVSAILCLLGNMAFNQSPESTLFDNDTIQILKESGKNEYFAIINNNSDTLTINTSNQFMQNIQVSCRDVDTIGMKEIFVSWDVSDSIVEYGYKRTYAYSRTQVINLDIKQIIFDATTDYQIQITETDYILGLHDEIKDSVTNSISYEYHCKMSSGKTAHIKLSELSQFGNCPELLLNKDGIIIKKPGFYYFVGVQKLFVPIN